MASRTPPFDNNLGSAKVGMVQLTTVRQRGAAQGAGDNDRGEGERLVIADSGERKLTLYNVPGRNSLRHGESPDEERGKAGRRSLCSEEFHLVQKHLNKGWCVIRMLAEKSPENDEILDAWRRANAYCSAKFNINGEN